MNTIKTHTKSVNEQMKNMTKVINDTNKNQINIQAELDKLRRETGENNKKKCNGRSEDIENNSNKQTRQEHATASKNNTTTKAGVIFMPKKKQLCEATKSEIKQKLKNYNVFE